MVTVETDFRPRGPEPDNLNLGGIQQELERKYAASKKPKGSKATDKAGTSNPLDPVVQTNGNAIGALLSIQCSSLDYAKEVNSPGSTSPQAHEPYEGGASHNSFPTPPLTSGVTLSTSPRASIRTTHSSYGTRILNLVPQTPPTPSTSYYNFLGSVYERPLVGQLSTGVRWTMSPLRSLSQTSGNAMVQSPKYTGDPHITEDISHDQPPSKTIPGQRQHRNQNRPNDDIARAPSLEFSRATWWDCLLSTYTKLPNTPYTISTRHSAASEISSDVCLFFKSAPLWLAFLNIPLFFDVFYHPELRTTVQPALVLSMLAYSKFIQSSSDPICKKGLEERERTWRQSVVLRDLAQASFEASYNAGWIDLPLAQAAWILALFEISSHRHSTLHRMRSSAALLDTVIHTLGLMSIDAGDPRAATFAADAVPALGRPIPNGVRDQALQLRHSATGRAYVKTSPESLAAPGRKARYYGVARRTPVNSSQPAVDLNGGQEPGTLTKSTKCPCHELSLATTPEALRSTPEWTYLPRWAPNSSRAEIRREEARRLVWNTVVMLGTDACARQAGGILQSDLHISKPENFAVLFPGEDDYSSSPTIDSMYSGKEGRLDIPLPGFSGSPPSSGDEQAEGPDAEFSMRAWMETIAIEEALDAHECAIQGSMLYE
ncbi:hypothetical protein FRB97_001322, partial [Tulasnella sp. 331]